MKNYYIVAVKKCINGYYPIVIKAHSGLNLASQLKDYDVANICDTKKEAENLYLQWVKDYHNNGTLSNYFYDFKGDTLPYILKYKGMQVQIY